MNIYMIGIKGAGMSALANVLLDDDYIIRGLDLDYQDNYSETLKRRGVIIDDINNKEYLKFDVIIIGHSFINDELIKELDENHKLWFEYHEFLSFYIERKKLVSICGSHGKTTLVNLLKTTIEDSSFLSGDGEGRKKDSDSFFFLESCEYKDHFLVYRPKEVIITNIDYDHVDYFKTEEMYIKSFNHFIEVADKVYINYEYKNKIKHDNVVTFGLNENADYYAKIINKNEDIINVEILKNNKVIDEYKIPNFGTHFVELFVANFAFIFEHNLKIDLQNKILSFIPSKQRFNIIKIKDNYINIDYAHHPSQIRNNYQICQEKYQKHIKIAIFKGDRLSRIKYFKNEIIEALNEYDFAYVLPLPNMENNRGVEVKILCSNKIEYLDDISLLKYSFDSTKKYSISLMSSKTLNREIEYLINLVKTI